MKRLVMLVALMALMAGPVMADRSMTGCTVDLIAPTTANPGETVTFEFYACNHSPDNEWTSNVIFTFPECFEVLGGSYNDGGIGALFNFVNDPIWTAAFMDGDGGWGEIYQDYCCTFYVEVLITTACECGPVTIGWTQEGDVFGAEPHTVSGELPFVLCGTPVQDSSWSCVKSLY